jgi:uncharacterized protein (TIGR02594 family)
MSMYVVRPGDTLRGIAKRAGTTVEQIQRLNALLTNPNRIPVGMALNLPGQDPLPRANGVGGDAPWYQIAMEELAYGVAEIPGSNHHPRILEYHATCSLKATNDETAWCSSFVNWCVIQAGLEGTNDAAARSWLGWSGGAKIRAPRTGAITVLRRGTQPWQGHVGFFVEMSEGYVSLLGGNQSDCVSLAPFPRDKILAFLWPT